MNVDLYLDNRCAFFQPEVKDHFHLEEDASLDDPFSQGETQDSWTSGETDKSSDSERTDG